MKQILMSLILVASTLSAQEPDSSSAIFQMCNAEQNFIPGDLWYSGFKVLFLTEKYERPNQ